MKHRLVALTAVVAVALTGGCGALGDAAAGSASDLAGTSPTPASTAVETVEAAEDGAIPDPCTLLSKAEVTDLTSREVTQIDEDGGAEGARFCQWQQSGGQLAIFLARTTPEDFEVTTAEAERVDGIGEGAFWASGHLYVLQGTLQLDVYSRGADPESGNLTDATAVAKVVLAKL